MATTEVRLERAAEAARLREEEGLNGIQIAERMGIGRSYAYSLLTDPDGVKDKARKSKGSCVRCGAPIRSDQPARGNPKHCRRCGSLLRSLRAKWTRLNIATAMQRWMRTFGQPPTATDWNVAELRALGADDRVRRFYEHPAGPWPHANDVRRTERGSRRFPSWNEAIAAAGLTPRVARNGGVGRGPGSVTEEDLRRTVVLVEEHGLDGAARLLGLTSQGVRVRLRKTDRKELVVMGSRLSPVDVMRREIERLNREIEEAEARAKEKREMVASYEKAIEVLAETNGTPSA